MNIGGQEEAPWVGIIIVEWQVEYCASLDVQQNLTPPGKVLESDADNKRNVLDNVCPIHPEAGLTMLYCPAPFDIFRVGVFGGIVEDVVR